jgi:hypothetical protein
MNVGPSGAWLHITVFAYILFLVLGRYRVTILKVSLSLSWQIVGTRFCTRKKAKRYG